jgi:hypothetical protein
MELILPAGEDWDESGKRLSHTLSSSFVFKFLMYMYFFGVCKRVLTDVLFPTCRQGSSAPS